jgi:hypothetical protein
MSHPSDRGYLARVSGVLCGRLALIAVLVTIALAIAYFAVSDRSFVLSAQTRGARIDVSGQTMTSWRLGRAKVCTRVAPRGMGKGDDPDCDGRLFDIEEFVPLEVSWPVGTVLSVNQQSNSAPFEILLVDAEQFPVDIGEISLTRNSRIIVTGQDFARSGTLLFSGYLTIGGMPRSGASDLLVNGRYEVHESLLFRNRPVQVADGEFFSGDVVTVIDSGGKSVEVSGFVTNAPVGDETGFELLAFSPAGNHRIEIERLGARPTIIASSWLDRAVQDPWLIGLSALIAAALSIMEVIKKTSGALSGRNPED